MIMGFGTDLNSIGDLITTAHATADALVNAVDAVADAIQLKTDNLPAIPADEAGLLRLSRPRPTDQVTVA